jgi:hypothetical protein
MLAVLSAVRTPGLTGLLAYVTPWEARYGIETWL